MPFWAIPQTFLQATFAAYQHLVPVHRAITSMKVRLKLLFKPTTRPPKTPKRATKIDVSTFA